MSYSAFTKYLCLVSRLYYTWTYSFYQILTELGLVLVRVFVLKNQLFDTTGWQLVYLFMNYLARKESTKYFNGSSAQNNIGYLVHT